MKKINKFNLTSQELQEALEGLLEKDLIQVVNVKNKVTYQLTSMGSLVRELLINPDKNGRNN